MTNEIEAARLRRIDEQNSAIFLAWQMEAIKHRVKHQKAGKKTKVIMPDLDKLLMPDQPTTRRKQNFQQMQAAVRTLAAKTGFPIKKVARGK